MSDKISDTYNRWHEVGGQRFHEFIDNTKPPLRPEGLKKGDHWVIIGGGIIANAIPKGDVYMTTNKGLQVFQGCDYYWLSDPRSVIKNKKSYESFKGTMVSNFEHIKALKFKWRRGKRFHGRCSGIICVRFAISMGAKKVSMIGFSGYTEEKKEPVNDAQSNALDSIAKTGIEVDFYGETILRLPDSFKRVCRHRPSSPETESNTKNTRLSDEGIYLNTEKRCFKVSEVANGAAGHVKISQSPQAHHVACWGWKVGKRLRSRGHEVLVFEHGYLNRKKWTSVAWNGLNRRADFRLPERVTADRFNRHFALRPWKQGGECFIIAGQMRGDASLQGRDLTMWYEEMAAALEMIHGLPVLFKQHPASRLRPHKCFAPNLPVFEGDINDACQAARCIVAWNSNATVDAVIAGCPAMTFDEGAMAWDVSSHDPAQIITPDREEWSARLAWCQWSKKEIASGAFWPRMLNLAKTPCNKNTRA